MRVPIAPHHDDALAASLEAEDLRGEVIGIAPPDRVLADPVPGRNRLEEVRVQLIRRHLEICSAVFLPDREEAAVGMRPRDELGIGLRGGGASPSQNKERRGKERGHR